MYTIHHKAFTMTGSTTMTIRVSAETKLKLGRIAADTKRSKSFLAAEAVSAYVDRELEIIDGVKRGMAGADAGRVVLHDDGMAELHSVIGAAEAKRAAKT
jgi:predicted transcriptional regulator